MKTNGDLKSRSPTIARILCRYESGGLKSRSPAIAPLFYAGMKAAV